MTRIINDIDLASAELKGGEVVALPTETVYGLAANALNPDAVLKIFQIKKRPHFNPLIVHIYDVSDVKKYAENISNDVMLLADKFSPGPLTFILKKKPVIPDIVTAGLDSVALRIPSHNMFRDVLKKTNFPLAAPSANMFGKVSATSAEDVLKDMKGKINYILNGGKCEVGIESTVIDFSNDEIRILRPGFITKEQIEETIGKTVKVISHSEHLKVSSPGMLKNHYSPETPLYLYEDENVLSLLDNKNIGRLSFEKYSDLKQMAVNLFSDLRKLDSMNYDFIFVKKLPEHGLGIAINDRVFRASRGYVIAEDNKVKFIDK